MAEAQASASAASLLQDVLCPPLARLRSCRTAGATPEAIHQARVATRRLRANLKDLRAVFGDGWDGDVRPQLAWVGGLLGGVRDADVLAAALETQLEAADARVRHAGGVLLVELRGERARSWEMLVEGLEHQRFAAATDRLATLIDAPPAVDCLVDPAIVMAPAWRSLVRSVRTLPPDPSDRQLHGVRIATKRARYAAEMFLSAYGTTGGRRFARRAARLQDALGRHQDAVMAVAWLRARKGTGPGVSFAAGWLTARFESARDGDRCAWRDAWESLARPKARFW